MQTLHVQKIMRVGNSLCVVLPARIAKELKWRLGDAITITPVSHTEIKIALLTRESLSRLEEQEPIIKI